MRRNPLGKGEAAPVGFFATALQRGWDFCVTIALRVNNCDWGGSGKMGWTFGGYFTYLGLSREQRLV